MVRRIRRRRGLPRLRREACSYHPQPLALPLSHEGWLLHLPAPNLAGEGVLRCYPGYYYLWCRNLRCRRFGCFLEVSSPAVPSPSPSFGVSTIYMSYDEVAVQRPTGAGSCSSPTSSSIPSKSSEPKSSMSVKSSTVATKWVVGGL